MTNTLFDNPMTRAALNSMSPEERKRYAEIGEKMYGNIDFDKSKILDNPADPQEFSEAVAYVEEQLKSGLHPSMLDDKEKSLLSEIRGQEWYLKWGYTKDDLNDMSQVHILKDKK